ncbi:MAG: methylmalonyl-CoA mutase family protein [Cyclobacteriaceae bacterium]
MPDKSIERLLEIFFSKSTKSDWKKIAIQETQGKDPYEILSWRGKDKILFLPYYDAQDVANLQFLNGFLIPAAKNTSSEQRAWENLPTVNEKDEAKANDLVLKHLSLGAQGALIDLRNVPNIDFSRLLQEIEWPYCFLAFHTNADTFFPDKLSNFIRSKHDPASVSGALFWESIPKKSKLDFYFENCPDFKALGLIVPPSSPAEEISDALLAGVRTFETLATSSSSTALVFRSIAFSLSADAVLIESYAKFKALRMLWYQVSRSYGHNDYNITDLHIHARSQSVKDGAYTPYENMLKGTFASMAAIMGGCNSLTVECESQPPLVPRWARNVSVILREESFFNEVSDPLAGAYGPDLIINEMASKAWELFQVKWERS